MQGQVAPRSRGSRMGTRLILPTHLTKHAPVCHPPQSHCRRVRLRSGLHPRASSRSSAGTPGPTRSPHVLPDTRPSTVPRPARPKAVVARPTVSSLHLYISQPHRRVCNLFTAPGAARRTARLRPRLNGDAMWSAAKDANDMLRRALPPSTLVIGTGIEGAGNSCLILRAHRAVRCRRDKEGNRRLSMVVACRTSSNQAASLATYSSSVWMASGRQRELIQGQAIVPAAAGAPAIPLAKSQLHPPVLHMRVISCTIPCHRPLPRGLRHGLKHSRFLKPAANGAAWDRSGRAPQGFCELSWRMPGRFFPRSITVEKTVPRQRQVPQLHAVFQSVRATSRQPQSPLSAAGHSKPQRATVGGHRPLLAGQLKPKQGSRHAGSRADLLRGPDAAVRLPDRQR